MSKIVRSIGCIFAVLVSLLACATPVRALIIYDGSLGTSPGGQNWLPVISGASSESVSGGAVQLDTTAVRGDASGYFSEDPFLGLFGHPDLGVLDRVAGYTLRFNLQVLSEAHDARDDNGDGKFDRAGFSIIALSQDLLGLEIGFFEDRVWAYASAGEGANSLFTQAEFSLFDTTAALTQYDYTVSGSSYLLTANGAPLLSGNLRNYNPSGVGALTNPYDNPSFVFFGDDTGSADSNTRIGLVELNPAPSIVPEPSTLLPLAVVFLVAVRRRRKHM